MHPFSRSLSQQMLSYISKRILDFMLFSWVYAEGSLSIIHQYLILPSSVILWNPYDEQILLSSSLSYLFFLTIRVPFHGIAWFIIWWTPNFLPMGSPRRGWIRIGGIHSFIHSFVSQVNIECQEFWDYVINQINKNPCLLGADFESKGR